MSLCEPVEIVGVAAQTASNVAMRYSANSAARRSFASIAAALIIGGIVPAVAQEPRRSDNSSVTSPRENEGLLGDDFARDTGAIIVTANRLGRGNLFEPVDIPEDACLAKAPSVGAPEPGFAIDASEMRRVRDLERVRRQTRAGTIFVSGGMFVGANFRRAKLYDMCFFGTDLSQTDWSGLSAQGLGFVGVDLTGANFTQTDLPFVLFRDSKLGLVDARGANWADGRIDGGWGGSLRELNLAGADLTGFEIVCGTSAHDGCPTERSGIDLTDANLRRASIHSFYVSDIALSGARIDQTEMALDHLQLLDEARLVGPIVLRSPRRAMMLFPGEVSELANGAESDDLAADICAEVQAPALQLFCTAPGSEPRTMLKSIMQLERAASGSANYAERRAAWAASRDACMELSDPDQQLTCIRQLYLARQSELREGQGTPDWLEAGSYRLFVSREAAYPTDAAKPGLYGRILPILLDSAVAAVIIRGDEEAIASAKGMTLDGCFFEAEGLAYDPQTGALAFHTPATGRQPAVIEEPLIALLGSEADVLDEGLARVGGCPPDDPFPRLEEIELDDQLLNTIWERF